MTVEQTAERIRQILTWGVPLMRRCIWPVRLDIRYQGTGRSAVLDWCRHNCRGVFMDAHDSDHGWEMRFENPADVCALVMAEEEGVI